MRLNRRHRGGPRQSLDCAAKFTALACILANNKRTRLFLSRTNRGRSKQVISLVRQRASASANEREHGEETVERLPVKRHRLCSSSRQSSPHSAPSRASQAEGSQAYAPKNNDRHRQLLIFTEPLSLLVDQWQVQLHCAKTGRLCNHFNEEVKRYCRAPRRPALLARLPLHIALPRASPTSG